MIRRRSFPVNVDIRYLELSAKIMDRLALPAIECLAFASSARGAVYTLLKFNDMRAKGLETIRIITSKAMSFKDVKQYQCPLSAPP